MLNNIYSLTINDDRYNYQCEVFRSRGLMTPFKYNGFQKISTNEKCCLFGHMSIIMMARCLKLPYVFIVEDDAYPRKDILEKLNYYIKNKPSDCGILVLGKNGSTGRIVYYGDYHIIYERPYGAHAYIVYKQCYDSVLQSMESVKIADIALKGDNFKDFLTYWTNENLFIQKQIDNSCMTKICGGVKYFYPNIDGTVGIYEQPPDDKNW